MMMNERWNSDLKVLILSNVQSQLFKDTVAAVSTVTGESPNL